MQRLRHIDLGLGWGVLVVVLIRYSFVLDNPTLYRKGFKNADFSTATICVNYLLALGMS